MITTAMVGSDHGPLIASVASSGAAIRLLPQIRTLLPNRWRCLDQLETPNWVRAKPINTANSTITTAASERPQTACRHAPGGINGSISAGGTLAASPDSRASARPISPNTTMFSAGCHQRPTRLDNAAVSPLSRNSNDAVGP